MPLSLSLAEGLGSVEPAEWDALAGVDNPFVEHAFLRLMETSGSVGEGTGWQPCHALLRDEAGTLQAAMPLYLKTNSYGEYIFDWAWANGSQRAGIPYYPKLTSAVPFTPATGPRLLVREGPDAPALRAALARGVLGVARELQTLSVHVLFCTEQEQEALGEAGYLKRASYQFHWRNQGYGCFEDFLMALKRKRRNEARRERKQAQEGLRIEVLVGDEIRPEHWRALYRFYRSTVASRGGIPYLKQAFFQEAGQVLGDRAVVVLAFDGDTPVGGTLNFRKGPHLYGRYWGCTRQQRALHFECCYYRLIEYAIEEGIELVEAGAQGRHKLGRGFLPSRTWSAHWLAHPGLSQAVEGFLDQEREGVAEEMDYFHSRSPFRPCNPDGGAA